MKRFILPFILFLVIKTNCQVAITEVYFDTPYSEIKESNPYHHIGEFIELFNYTTEDIDIGGWFLSDKDGNFVFPNNTIIKSGDFLIITYADNKTINKFPNFFIDLFPNSKEHKNKIIYTDKLILNNFKEDISLTMTSVRGKPFVVKTDILRWRINYKEILNGFKYFNNNLRVSNDYYLKSLHKINQSELEFYDHKNNNIIPVMSYEDNHFKKANPFELHFKPSLINIQDIRIIKEYFYQLEHFGELTIIPELFNLKCKPEIPIISYSIPKDSFSEIKCFNYDEAGNYIFATNENECSSKISVVKSERISYEDYFFVTPNPTTGKVNIIWDKSMEYTLSQIHIIPFNGSNSIEINFDKKQYNTNYDLTNLTKGIYFIRFTLNNGHIITKKIIKL